MYNLTFYVNFISIFKKVRKELRNGKFRTSIASEKEERTGYNEEGHSGNIKNNVFFNRMGDIVILYIFM